MIDDGMTWRVCAVSVTKDISENISNESSSSDYVFDLFLLSGREISFADYPSVKWIVAERLDNNVYALQSLGICRNAWPYLLNGVNYNMAYQDISSINTSIKECYDAIISYEANGGRIDDKAIAKTMSPNAGTWVSGAVRDGMYLINQSKVADENCPNYITALTQAGVNKGERYYPYAWLGTAAGYIDGDYCANYVYKKQATGALGVEGNYVLAPVFNLNTANLTIINDVITKK